MSEISKVLFRKKTKKGGVDYEKKIIKYIRYINVLKYIIP